MNRRTNTSTPPPLHSLSRLTSDLRRTVSTRLMREFGVRVPPALIRRVVDEASEVAQETGFPNLFFPALAEEKARLVFAALSHHHLDHMASALSHAA